MADALKLSSKRARILIGVGAGVAIAATVAAVRWPTSTPSPGISLEPSTNEARYRFDPGPKKNPREELEATITAAEARQKASPSDPLEMGELANLYYVRAQLDGDRRDYDEAEKLARQSLAILPAPNGATLTLAKLANARHEFGEAIEIARGYQGRNPAAVPMVHATAYLALGQLEQAMDAANRAVKARPSPSTYLERALVLQAQGRDAEAENDFSSAVRVEDQGDVLESARVRALWARFLVRRGLYQGAQRVIDEALRISPDNALALSIRAELVLRMGDPKRARSDLENAFVASHQVRYLIDEARALELSGDRDGANALRTKVETIVRDELSQGGLGHRLELVEVLLDRGEPARFAEAVAAGREEVTKRPGAEAHFQLARALAWSGQRDEAIEQIQAALASGAREPQYYELAARLEVKAGNATRASLYAQLARSLDPDSSGWRALGMPP